MNPETLAAVLGWCTLINLGLLLFSTVALMVGRDWIQGKHQQWFDLEPKDLQRAYFRYLAQFKLLVLIFNLAPYIALKLVLATQASGP